MAFCPGASRSLSVSKNKKPRYCTERADRTAFSGIAVQHADDGYSGRGNFWRFACSQCGFNLFTDGSNECSSGGSKFEGIGSCRGLKLESCKIVFIFVTSYSLVQTLLLYAV